MGGGLSDSFVNNTAGAIARWAAHTAQQSITGLTQAFGTSTDPDFHYIQSAYSRVLAVALLLIGAFVAFGLAERLLGGGKGIGWQVLPRTLMACFAAFVSLSVIEQASHYSSLLGSLWNQDFTAQANSLMARVSAAYASPDLISNHLSTGGLIVTGVLTLLLAMVVYVELVLRAALILVMATFVPLICVMAVWPRLASAGAHLFEFLMALMLSKFVVATAIFVGFSMAAQRLQHNAPNGGAVDAALVGVATLALAAFSPLLLMQGIRFSEAATASVVRGWGGTTAGIAIGIASFGAARVVKTSVAPVGSAVRRLLSKRGRT